MENYSRLLTDKELSIYSLEHIFSMCSSWYDEGMNNTIATFDLLVRDMPKHRNFLLAGGLEAIINYLIGLSYDEGQIKYLLDEKRISANFADYLRKFSFSGDVYAMPEGTVYFPGEPMVRTTAPLVEANLITDILISLATIDTMLLSKLARVRIAGRDKRIGVGFVRSQGIDAGWRAGRNSYFFENMGVSNAAMSKRLKTKSLAVIVAHHAYIKSFPSEIIAMRTIANKFPGVASLMIDTYDIDQGIENAIKVAKELKQQGKELGGITVDSGNLAAIAKKVRRKFDTAGFNKVKISVASNLNEYKIDKMLKGGVPADSFLVVTEVITSADAPTLETVYKVCMLEKKGEITYTAKFSPGKLSLPGKKQVFRIIKNGKIKKDIIGLEDESLGNPLLIPVIRKGKQVYKVPSLEESRTYTTNQLASLPDFYKDIYSDRSSPLSISKKVKDLLETVRKQHNAHKE